MASGGGKMASGFLWFALVHAGVTLIMFVLLEERNANAEHFDQCMEACPVLSLVELCSALFLHNILHVTTTVCSAVEMLAAALALLYTGRLSRAASFVALFLAVFTGSMSIRLFYTALFGTHCCFSGGIVQVAFALAVVFGQGAISLWGSWVAYDLAHRDMATKGGEERMGDVVPAPVVSAARSFTGMDPPVLAIVVCVRGFLRAVAMAIFLGVRDCQRGACLFGITALLPLWLIDGVEILTAMLFLDLLSTRRLSRVISYLEYLVCFFKEEQLFRFGYVTMLVSRYYFEDDIVKFTAVAAVIVVGDVALTFWGVKFIQSFYPYRADDQEQYKRGSTSGSELVQPLV